MSEPAEKLPPHVTELIRPVTVKPPSPETMWAELSIAINYLTRFNLSFKEEPKPHLIRKSMAWFPLVGATVGIFGASIDWLMSLMRMPGLITSTFAVVGLYGNCSRSAS